jgi:glycosyltransferase involved in cell wall biosynthesis
VVEAFAHRTPVIVRDIGAPRELVEESGGGRLFRNVDELRTVLSELLAPELREQLAANGYRAFRERWSKRTHLDRYYDLIRRTAIRKFGALPWESDTGPSGRSKGIATQ